MTKQISSTNIQNSMRRRLALGFLNLDFEHCLFFVSCILGFALFLPMTASAQAGLSVTLTPPLFQLTIGPGETWASGLKIVNNNSYDVTYYAQVVDMEASGESGQSKFIPVLGPQDPSLVSAQLARWVTLEAVPITIKAGRSETLNFTVSIPIHAEPGGHYAAILVGTEPLATSASGSQMKISSYVSSLMFVRVKGDVIESGRIREFTSDKDLYQTPKADFVLRFENTGNTHLKPEGDVTIYNMWGKERGKVLINQEANFGNALPKTIRRFEFSWEGESDVFDIGRYSAVVTLAYGDEGKKNVTATTYFWVVPIVPVAATFGTIALLLLLLAWFIRRYIRSALALERERYGAIIPAQEHVSHAPILETMMEPIRESVVDLRKMRATVPAAASPGVPAIDSPSLTKSEFFRKYRLFFAFMFVICLVIAGGWFYFAKVLVSERDFNIKALDSQEETLTP
jgi:hypothetical protein